MSETTTVETTQPVEGAKPDEALGEGGKKALDAERSARKAADRRANALRVQLDQLKQRAIIAAP